MKKVFLFVFAAMLILPNLVFAQSANLYLDFKVPDLTFSPCVDTLTSNEVLIQVTNTGETTQTYNLVLDLPRGWSGLIEPEITLEAGETKEITTFFVSSSLCNLPTGTEVPIKVKVKSLQDQVLDTETLKIPIVNTHYVDLELEKEKDEVCRGETKTYNVTVINLGKETETFDLFTNVTYASLSESSLTLEPNEERTLTLTVSSVVESKSILVKIKSKDSWAENEKVLSLEVKDCYNFELTLQPLENNVCLGKSINYTLKIKNTGSKEDSYEIKGPSWVYLETETVSLGPNEEKEVNIEVKPEQKGRMSFNLSVSSSNLPELEKNVQGFVNSIECRGVAVIVFPLERTVCKGEIVRYDVIIKNIGTIESTFDLTSSLGSLERDRIILSPGETNTVGLELVTTDLMGNITLNVKASDGVVFDQQEVKISIENCYSAKISITPETQKVCPCFSVNYTATLENTGKFPDNYTFKFGEFIEQVSLNPGESKDFELSIQAECDAEPGNHTVKATAESDHVSVEGYANLEVKEREECYLVGLETEETEKYVKILEAAVIPIKVKNLGENPDKYKLSVKGPNWVYLSPNEVKLGPKEEKEVYLYVSPPFGTSLGNYKITVNAKSDYSSSKLNINCNVLSETGELPSQNVTLNITPPTGLITGEERPLWKIVTVVLISLAIIVILVIRFIFLLKK